MCVCEWVDVQMNTCVSQYTWAYVPCALYRYVCSRKMVESEKIIPILKVEE